MGIDATIRMGIDPTKRLSAGMTIEAALAAERSSEAAKLLRIAQKIERGVEEGLPRIQALAARIEAVRPRLQYLQEQHDEATLYGIGEEFLFHDNGYCDGKNPILPPAPTLYISPYTSAEAIELGKAAIREARQHVEGLSQVFEETTRELSIIESSPGRNRCQELFQNVGRFLQKIREQVFVARTMADRVLRPMGT